MQNLLMVIDMQNDFVDGALGTKEAVAIVDNVAAYINKFDGNVLFTRDTHADTYMHTLEGKFLPVAHCIEGTHGWQLNDKIEQAKQKQGKRDLGVVDKTAFSDERVIEKIKEINDADSIRTITLMGLCTDICVISNAFVVKTLFPEKDIYIEGSCCAGVTPQG
ncbi:MAG: cysteine hydrolase, partial [Eggerthellaceae bacterium]|nr:cysteine hydrolase [Eggerthellaceae bacterium]